MRLCIAVLLLGVTVADIEPGFLPESWNHGSAICRLNSDPRLQVHEYNENLFIMRENKCVNYEAPFVYLLFGEKFVYLQDTTNTADPLEMPLRRTVEELIERWLERRGRTRDSIELIVAHSHAHGDHIAADPQFLFARNTHLVSPRLAAVERFFNITHWPEQRVEFDLGGRVLDIVPIPGHEPSSLAVYDRRTGILFTGDSLYPGRLYVQEWTAYRASIRRLHEFAASVHIEHVLGNHIEMSRTPHVEYSVGTTYQPHEHRLELEYRHLVELDIALRLIGPLPRGQSHADFLIMPVTINYANSVNNPIRPRAAEEPVMDDQSP